MFRSPKANYKTKFENKVIVITGASSGLGYELAKELSKYRPKLVLAARGIDKMKTLKTECEQAGAMEVFLVQTDVSIRKDCENLIQATIQKFGAINVLYLNAGVGQATRVSDIKDPSVLQKVMDTNFFGAINTAYYALPHLRATKGHIVVTSSIVSQLTLRGASAYCASKAAVSSFFDTLRKEEKDIKITILCPGYVPTDILNNSLTGDGSAKGKNSQELSFMTPLDKAVRIMIDSCARNKAAVWFPMGASILMSIRGAFPNAIDRIMIKFRLG
jgi:short-subunit dehydrogenase